MTNSSTPKTISEAPTEIACPDWAICGDGTLTAWQSEVHALPATGGHLQEQWNGEDFTLDSAHAKLWQDTPTMEPYVVLDVSRGSSIASVDLTATQARRLAGFLTLLADTAEGVLDPHASVPLAEAKTTARIESSEPDDSKGMLHRASLPVIDRGVRVEEMRVEVSALRQWLRAEQASQ